LLGVRGSRDNFWAAVRDELEAAQGQTASMEGHGDMGNMDNQQQIHTRHSLHEHKTDLGCGGWHRPQLAKLPKAPK